MSILKYKGGQTYFDPAGRFFLEQGDLVDVVEPEAVQLAGKDDFDVATDAEIKAAAKAAQAAAAAQIAAEAGREG